MNKTINLKLKVVIANIKKVRQYRNYSQEYVAAKLLISQNAYSKVELGQSLITIDRLILIANIFQVEVKLLLSEENLSIAKLYKLRSVIK